ncbi:hypothetical protein [Oceanobacter mangrovi]|uniref:hypothetical protein n=1 Tax=Oceanobacter mangrovi TaxID=2862510 RepID=UPI001C8D2D4A|nr:hypothetical protein [Oceanobacter mangrovi]
MVDVSAAANHHMANLALKFELQTGNKIRWRDAPAGMAAILNLSFHSGQPELIKLANTVVEHLSEAVLNELQARGFVLSDGANTYRGSRRFDVGGAAAGSASDKVVYRGSKAAPTAASASAVEAKPADSQPKSRRVYRGRVIED